MGGRVWGFFVSALQTGFFWPLVGLYQISQKQFKRSPLALDFSVYLSALTVFSLNLKTYFLILVKQGYFATPD